MSSKNRILIFLFLFFVSCSCISAYTVSQNVPLSIRVMYDNGFTLSNIPTPCRLSLFNHDIDSFVLRNVSMTPSGAFHTYNYVPTFAGSYTASALCSYGGDSSAYWFDFVVDDVVTSPNGTGRGINPSGGSTLVGVGSILPERSAFTVNKLDDSVLKFSTQYFSDSQLINSRSASWKLLKNSVVIDSGSLLSTATGVYSFSYDFVDLPVGDYQVALSFDGNTILVDVGVVSREPFSLITGLITSDDGSVSSAKLGVLLFVVLFIIIAIILLIRSLTKRPVQYPNSPRRGFENR